MTFKDILSVFRTTSFSEKVKGTRFEHLMKRWLLTEPLYAKLFKQVWLWEEFPSRKDFGGKDLGIDLVGYTNEGQYYAIQCKCYAEDATVNKGDLDSFLSTSSKKFIEPETLQTCKFSYRLWICTSSDIGSNAKETIENQDPEVHVITLGTLSNSDVNWDELLKGSEGAAARNTPKSPLKHQIIATEKALAHYADHDRGQLIMACGTGKTYTSLQIAEAMLPQGGLVLFMVPSIALVNQSLIAWSADAKMDMHPIVICSDVKASVKASANDFASQDTIDLALPATTNPKTVTLRLNKYMKEGGLTVIFSTYQSIDAVMDAQREILKQSGNTKGIFDLIICDEAHRTTGSKLSGEDESSFIKVHSDDNIKGRKRLYMTATPRLFAPNAKTKAADKDITLWSMDDESWFGKEFYRVNFSYAVQNNLLTDYKVLVLTVSEDELPASTILRLKNDQQKEMNYDDSAKLLGVISGLSKIIKGDEGRTWEADPRMMRRAVAFCSTIGNPTKSSPTPLPGSSKIVAKVLPQMVEDYRETVLNADANQHIVSIATRHVDGSIGTIARNAALEWLKDTPEEPNECRIITNVRCLSEGVDVPALDAVIFLSPRNSQVDVVQSVGRVMRNFHKGQVDEKKYGYIIIPIVVPPGVKAEDALDDNETYKTVWQILNALRAHDDEFNATVEAIRLNKKKEGPDSGNNGKITWGGIGSGSENPDDTEADDNPKSNEVVQKLLQFAHDKEAFYAKLVEKCGEREYWTNWAKSIGTLAQKFITRITAFYEEGKYCAEFDAYIKGLQANINPTVNAAQAIEMLAQHMICRPVFDALFGDYQFVTNNAVSRSMQRMVELMINEALGKDTEQLENFYQKVRVDVSKVKDLEGKQAIIKRLYEEFFKHAFPLTVEKLGIVYTPIECVDFIIHSVDDILRKEFDTSLTEENVHILDPFTGTGTFITRLLQSGLIRPEDMERKYRHEIHCNEIVLLAYYIADVNIESVFHQLTGRSKYLNYDGICLTDTFQMNESKQKVIEDSSFFPENTEQVLRQKKAPVRVIIGNPPYSVGQKSADDNAANNSYPKLEERIADTYAKNSSASSVKALYDSYIKAFRWATDRIDANKEGGIIAFISNGSWLDSNGTDTMRACLEREFSSIYVLNLRGNQRTSGELSRREGGKIFGSGSRTPITITFLVKHPNHTGKGSIYYHDIGDYLSREQKLELVKSFKSAITGNNPQVLFATGSYQLTDSFKVILDKFIPRYLNILLKDTALHKNIQEIRIEGHTDNVPAPQFGNDPFMANLKLSQLRSYSVMEYIRLMPKFQEYTEEQRAKLEYWFTSNGLSYGKAIDANGEYIVKSGKPIDKDRSRRVEFRIVTTGDEVLENFVKENSSLIP